MSRNKLGRHCVSIRKLNLCTHANERLNEQFGKSKLCRIPKLFDADAHSNMPLFGLLTYFLNSHLVESKKRHVV